MADHLFFSEVGEGSVERTVLIMLWHVKEANQLIQAKVRTLQGDNGFVDLKFQAMFELTYT